MRNLRTSGWFCVRLMPHDSLVRFTGVAGTVLLSVAALAAMAPAQAQTFAYVSVGNSVVVIDTATNAPISTVGPLIDGASWAPAVAPDGGFVYVPNGGPADSNGFLSVIDAATNAVDTVEVGFRPVAVALTPDGAFAYVANQSSHTVSVLNTATSTVDATVGVGPMPSSVAITPDGAFAYVANRAGASVSVIRTATNTVDAIVPLSSAPLDLAVTPDGSHVYVSTAPSTLSVISTATNTVEAMVPLGFAPRSVAVSPDGAFAYVLASLNFVLAIDTATNATVGAVILPAGGCDIAVTPNGASLYVTGFGAGDVSVLDTATLAPVAMVPGIGGCGIAIADRAPSATEVTVDVNGATINPGSKQKLSVAIVTTDTFDALQVDAGTVLFGPAEASEYHGRAHVEDVDGDGDADLLFHFDVGETGIGCGDTEATLVGATYGDEAITGTGTLRTAACPTGARRAGSAASGRPAR